MQWMLPYAKGLASTVLALGFIHVTPLRGKFKDQVLNILPHPPFQLGPLANKIGQVFN